MPIQQRTLTVRGLRDLQKAWAVADKETSKELRSALRDAAEPVKTDAQTLAATSIKRPKTGGPDWSRMRVGVTRKSVYVAPKQRSTRNKSMRREKWADRIAFRAMQPALDRNIHQVEAKVDDALGTVGRKWESA